ncbi:MAG TPA: response regulator transcription factor [Paucimonas sp.]|nr:response regulator transcription factor [Paucimonas sp.]
MSPQPLPVPVTVLLVEDDALTRRALSLAIESDPYFKLAACFDSVAPALEWLAEYSADILLTDLGLPDGTGIDIIHACVRAHPRCDIMVVTMSSDEANVLACIEAGASGYVLKDAGRLDVVRALKDLRAGGAPMSPAIARMVLARVRGKKRAVPQPEAEAEAETEAGVEAEVIDTPALTKREATILDLIARGDTYGEVAKLLEVSVGTVQTHIKNIYSKLSVHSRGEAVFEAHRRGLLQMKKPLSAAGEAGSE